MLPQPCVQHCLCCTNSSRARWDATHAYQEQKNSCDANTRCSLSVPGLPSAIRVADEAYVLKSVDRLTAQQHRSKTGFATWFILCTRNRVGQGDKLKEEKKNRSEEAADKHIGDLHWDLQAPHLTKPTSHFALFYQLRDYICDQTR